MTERPLRDGRTEVHVILKTSNALTWVFNIADYPVDSDDPFNEVPLVFGARVPEILEGARPALRSETAANKALQIDYWPGRHEA